MTTREDEPRSRGSSAGKSPVHGKVAQFYYAQGLLCSSYPLIFLCVAIAVAILSCYPLLNLPLPGNSPQLIWTSSNNLTSPFCYVQQVVLKSAVLPWRNDLKLGDAFRAPLYEAFKVLEIVRNYQNENDSKTLGHVCLHVEAISKGATKYKNVLPEYSCLVLSPANLWQQDVVKFSADSSLLSTIFGHHNFQKGKPSITEMVFGMKVFDTGIKRYPLRNRYRIIQYAVTLFLKDYDERFINGLRHKLHTSYTLHQNQQNESSPLNDTLIIQYADEINLFEFVPISLAFVILFLYFYFSFRKIELIYSKLGMAFSAVATLCGSLSMTYGLCFFFGLTLNLDGKVVFPYLVLLVGVENVLCLTRSVVSVPLHLDVKIRLAQGLSKEGWSIAKNLFLEITIMTFGIFTFVPVIQEFCIFAVVGLVTDYFMQMVFFSTVLGIDIRRKDHLAEKNNFNFRSSQAFYDKSLGRSNMRRSKSHPRLSFPADIVAGQAQGVQEKKIPKRLRLVNIWARTRLFHRSFMILMIVWILSIAYDSGFIERYILNNHYFQTKEDTTAVTEQERNYSSIKLFPLLNTNNSLINKMSYVTQSPIDVSYQQNDMYGVENLKHATFQPWLRLSPMHWPSILRKYNISVSGQSIAILPSIKISHTIHPEQAIPIRNPNEQYGERFQWQALAAALDPIDFPGMEASTSKSTINHSEQPFYPTSVFAMILIAILCLISVIVLGYIVVVFYRCICSRNYAEWRASWFSEKSEEQHVEEQVLLEAVPVILEGHQQAVECIATDGTTLVSSSLDGQLKVWDSHTGELLINVDRKAHFAENISVGTDEDCVNSSDYESGSPPSHDEWSIFPNLKRCINLNFSKVKERSPSTSYDSKLDFIESYRALYLTRDRPSHKKYRTTKDWQKSKESKRPSFSDHPAFNERQESVDSVSDCGTIKCANATLQPIWCVEYLDNLIVIGCADGRLEFWEATTGRLKCIFEDGSNIGISNLKIVGSKIIAARLYGTLEVFQLQTYNHGRPVDWNFTRAYRRAHVRTGSFGSVSEHNNLINQGGSDDEELRCLRVHVIKAHQQPILCLDCEGGRILTGSQDHTLKVFRLEDGSAQYTLHGHCGPITCLFIDRVSPATSGSGSQDGMLCVWDLLTGACMYNNQAHDGSITSLTYSASYVISLGSDDRLCVWERFQGHLLNTIQISQTFSSQVLMLAPHLVITAQNGGLVIWDVRTGDCVRTISLGRSPFIFIKQLMLLRDAVFCDYGNQLRIVRFPLITHKFD